MDGRSWTKASGVAGLLGVVACSSQPQGVSNLKHDMGQPTRGTASWMWQDTTDQEYAKVMAPLVGVKADKIFGPTHPLTKRAQYWLDKIDDTLRTAHPDALVNVPKPRAKVVSSEVTNAFVAPVPVCYDTGMRLNDDGEGAVAALVVNMNDGSLESFPEVSSIGCVQPKSQDDLTAFFKAFNARGGDCQFELTGSVVAAGKACKRDADLERVTSAERVVLLQTSNHVTVFTPIIQMMPEADFVSVVAHELGHYYRSHGTAPEQDYGFFYKLDAANPDRRPTPEAAAEPIGKAAYAGAALLGSEEMYTAVKGQELSSNLYPVAGSLMAVVCESQSCPVSCLDASALVKSDDFATTMGKFPFGKLTDAQVKGYEQFEAAAKSCLQSLAFGEGNSAESRGSRRGGGVRTSGGTFTWESVVTAAASPTWPSWISSSSVSPKLRRAIAQANMLLAARLKAAKPAATGAKDLWSALQGATGSFKADDDAAVGALKQAFDHRVGQYTIEQEADEESAEWVASLGLDPLAGADAMMQLGKLKSDEGLSGFLLGDDACESLRSRGWLGQDGSYAFVPVGDYSEIHHSTCYRAFNIEREVKAHRLTPAPGSAPKPDGPTWADLQATAAQPFSRLEEGVVNDDPYFGGSGIARVVRKQLSQCTYAQRP